jgi:hypothetical protein
MPPTFVRLTRRALEGGPVEPSNGGECFSYDYTGLRHDVRPAGTVLSVAVSPVRPSPPLQHHAGCCDDIPDVVGVHGDGTSPRLPLYPVRTPVDGTLEPTRGQWPDGQPLRYYPRSCSCTGTGHATTPQQEQDSCWGSGPAHVRVSGPLCGLEGFLVNTASTRDSEENNH